MSLLHRRRHPRRCLDMGLALLLLWAMPTPVHAAESKVIIGIRVIYAVRDTVRSIDPALEDIRSELNELPASKFRLLDRLEATVAMKSAVELQLPGDRSVSVRFQGIDESKGKQMLSLELAMKPALKIELKVADGGRYLVAGPSHLEGKLILDVSAKLKEPKP